MLALLNHPHIIRLEFFTRTPESWLMFLEEDAGSVKLSDYIKNQWAKGRPQKWPRLAHQFGREIGSALRYCHLHCIFHHNLSADKIVVTPRGIPKMSSFEAPSFYFNDDFDAFSYGAVLWHILCGDVPWPAAQNRARHALDPHITLSKDENLSECKFHWALS